jgi:hypothetical protein
MRKLFRYGLQEVPHKAKATKKSMSDFVKKFADQDSQNFGACTGATVTAACRLPLPVCVLQQPGVGRKRGGPDAS